MKQYFFFSILFFFGSLSINPVQAQEQLTEADYARAVSFLWQNVNNKKAFNLNVSPNWFPDSTGFWYTIQDKTGKSFMQFEFAGMQPKKWFDHDRLAELLTNETGEKVKATDLPLQTLKYISKSEINFRVKNKNFKLDIKSYQLSLNEEKEERENLMESKSPDGKWIAFSKDYNLFIKSVATGVEKQLSHTGVKNYEYASYYGWDDIIEGEGGERPARFDVSWSPDSKWIATNICDLRSGNKMYLLNWSIDSLYRPKLLSYYRGSPGDTNMVYMIPVLFEIESGREIRPDLPRNTHINAVSTRWSKSGEKLFADYATRGYQNHYVLSLNMKNLQLDTIIHEQSKTNIDNFFYTVIEEKGKVLFASERSGWRQLYLLDLKTKVVTHLAKGEYYMNDVLYIDENKGIIYFTASGKETGSNPYQQYLYKVTIEKNELKLLTPEKFNHDISFSPDGKYFTDNYSTAQQPTTTVLREAATGKIVTELAKADISALQAMNWTAPQIFTSVARDDKTEIYGALWKPTNFDPNKKYPVIDNSYTGPHTQVFPRNFTRVLSINNQALAELGFIVMMVDGLGSSGRSKAFHDVSYKNMGFSLTDHMLAIKQLAEKYAWIDAEHVGIFGHSAGGYDAGHALLQFPDFYKVGVASSGDHDHRMEKAWWPEMYMGWPVDSAYHQQSNITMAANLKGKLLLVHGGIDENVNPSATFKLAENLVKADKQFDLLIFPSQRHGYTGKFSDYFTKKRWNYFVEHLLDKKPLWEFSLEEKPKTH
jgi:dipeptidyl aminopeptidase/acylaminoacyl peptidase